MSQFMIIKPNRAPPATPADVLMLLCGRYIIWSMRCMPEPPFPLETLQTDFPDWSVASSTEGLRTVST